MNGETIDCKVTLADSTQLVRDGRTTALAADEALAFYVTGSSQSGGSFNVPVHLWRRRRQRDSPPATQAKGTATMDVAHWYDTYVTCCVLHVP